LNLIPISCIFPHFCEVSGFDLGSSLYIMVSITSRSNYHTSRYFNYFNLKVTLSKVLTFQERQLSNILWNIFLLVSRTKPTPLLVSCRQANHWQENPLRANEFKEFIVFLISKTVFNLLCIFNLGTKVEKLNLWFWKVIMFCIAKFLSAKLYSLLV
jgi:hypothetical protein